jgi:GNAT superfamily N-acetyltransferase
MHAAEIRDFSSKRNFICFIAWDEDKKAVGFTEASIRPFANGCKERPVPFLEGLWVDPRFRRRKIGKKLISAVESWASKPAPHQSGRAESGVQPQRWNGMSPPSNRTAFRRATHDDGAPAGSRQSTEIISVCAQRLQWIRRSGSMCRENTGGRGANPERKN